MPLGHMHHAGGAILLAVAIVIAATAGIARNGPGRTSAVVTVLAALLGAVLIYYILRRL